MPDLLPGGIWVETSEQPDVVGILDAGDAVEGVGGCGLATSASGFW
jgi:hypothetical protein